MSESKKRFLSVAGVAVWCLLSAAIVIAGNLTITYSAQQSNATQNKLIPDYNRRHCIRFGLAGNCNTATLQTKCSVKTITGGPFDGLVTDSCTIFPSNAAGEAAYRQERANQGILDEIAQFKAGNGGDFCSTFNAASQATQDQVCTDLGLGAGCNPPCN